MLHFIFRIVAMLKRYNVKIGVGEGNRHSNLMKIYNKLRKLGVFNTRIFTTFCVLK